MDVTDEELEAVFEGCKNWGRWGGEDQLGTLNFITSETRAAAARTVRAGDSRSICRPLLKGPGVGNHPRVDHHMSMFPGAPGSYDYVGISCHGRYLTHLDALAHGSWQGRTYNGFPLNPQPAEVLGYGNSAPGGLSHDGAVHCSITTFRNGIFARGVLLDVAAAVGVDWLEPTYAITAEDLDRAEELSGVVVGRGDALFVRTGLLHPDRNYDYESEYSTRAGLVASAAQWMYAREISVYGGDVIEMAPYRSPSFPTPFHQIALCAIGLALLDWPDVEALKAACVEHERSEFLLTVAPLPVAGSTGSAVNPIATF